MVTEDPSKDHKKAFLKMQKLGKTIRDYLLLGTQYGDVHGDHEPVRRDWFRAVFVSAEDSVITDANRLWPKPDTSKKQLRANADWQKANAGTYVEISDTVVRVAFEPVVDRILVAVPPRGRRPRRRSTSSSRLHKPAQLDRSSVEAQWLVCHSPAPPTHPTHPMKNRSKRPGSLRKETKVG